MRRALSWIGLFLLALSFVWFVRQTSPRHPNAAPRRPTGKAKEPLVVVLDPGHGGQDSGEMCGAVMEKDLALDVALRAFGRLDRVVLNAGVPGAPTPLSQEAVATVDRILAVNLRGVFLGLRATLAHLRVQGEGGGIVVTASTAGVSGSELGAYSASKHGVVALARSAAIEGAEFGVRVNAIAPGSIDTPMMACGGVSGLAGLVAAAEHRDQTAVG